MRPRQILSALAVALAASAGAVPAVAAQNAARTPAPTTATTAATKAAGPTVYIGTLSPGQLGALRSLGLDHEDFATTRLAGGSLAVEAVVTHAQAALLRGRGIVLTEKRVDGQPVSQRLAAGRAASASVFRPWSGAGGLEEEFLARAAAHPGLVKVVQIGRSAQGQDILAFKVTKNARSTPDGTRPATLYISAQHAREWITPEMNRRLLAHLVDSYPANPRIRRLLETTELWFVPVANPDGYDFTFTEGNRLWRKTLRDNDGDGAITSVDGVDPNRNWAYRWGYDNEGSSPSPDSETYRGTAPGSEPETKALDGLMARIPFAFAVNYHSAAELLLYGTGWQVATRTPDDVVYEALAGDDARPAVPGYDPDQSAELYTTNGETTEHAHNVHGILGFTPEMSTCQTASAVDPADAFDPADCASVFTFPDSEKLVQAEFRKNLPFALSVAFSAADPSNPVSSIGRSTPDFEVDSFTVSYGDPQTVAVTARRDLRGLTVHWSVAGGPARSAPLREWTGGERYGTEGDVYYAQYRGQVRGARPGQSVTVWFTGQGPGGSRAGTRTSAPFTYRLVEDSGADVLILANEDWKGVNPTYPAGTTTAKYAPTYRRALADAGYTASVYDVDRLGSPHPLGVLGHFRGVVWYLGDNRLTQDPEDELTTVEGQGDFPDASVAERQYYLTLAVRDYLNEGGKVVHTGETAAYYGVTASQGGIFYGLNGDPTAECVVSSTSECLLLADDITQYWFGAYSRAEAAGPTSFVGSGVLGGAQGVFGGSATAANPLDEPGIFTPTSAVLPAQTFPQFASAGAGAIRGSLGGAFDPATGDWYAGVLHVNGSYARLARTIDLTAVSAGRRPALEAKFSVDVEEGYDHVIVEAREVGTQRWTTLADRDGATSTEVPADCEQGFFLAQHPALRNYLTAGEPCTATGRTGAWNSITGKTGGWVDTHFDLSAYAGKRVQVSITYVSDPGFGGTAVLVDDTAVVAGGKVLSANGFERGLGDWSVLGPPAGSPTTGGRFTRSSGLLSGAVSTSDTVLLGVGVEQFATAAERSAVLGAALRAIL